MKTNFKVIGLTRLEIKPETTAPQMDALATRPSEVCEHIQKNTNLTHDVHKEQLHHAIINFAVSSFFFFPKYS